MNRLLDKLEKEHILSEKELVNLIEIGSKDSVFCEKLRVLADGIRKKNYSNKVYIRGLIEVSSYCKNNCLYCGIRRDNKNAKRYRLKGDEILKAVKEGYALGLRTFVLQGGEDPGMPSGKITNVIERIKGDYPDVAVTLSLGELEEDVLREYKMAGADRYLLRHETADKEHYSSIHPPDMSYSHRIETLYTLKKLGYQTGLGFMVGSPGQGAFQIAKDLRFIRDFKPEMVGIGPFISHRDTPFAYKPNGSVKITLFLLSVIRIMLPNVLLPATTALGTLVTDGRERGIMAGANVIMPNLTPLRVRGKYEIYDNKLVSGAESAQMIDKLKSDIQKIGYEIVTDVGNHPDFK